MLDFLLIDGRSTATALSERLPVSPQAGAKHLGVATHVGLVHPRRAGRERIDEAQFARAVVQLFSFRASWDARLRRIKRIAEAMPSGDP